MPCHADSAYIEIPGATGAGKGMPGKLSRREIAAQIQPAFEGSSTFHDTTHGIHLRQ